MTVQQNGKSRATNLSSQQPLEQKRILSSNFKLVGTRLAAANPATRVQQGRQSVVLPVDDCEGFTA